MTGSLASKRILTQVQSLQSGTRPELCNVYAIVTGFPTWQKGKWYLRVRGLSSSGQEIFVVVHDDPQASQVSLPYDSTSPQLLRMFSDERQRSLFQPGEELLVQGVPRVDSQGLGLHVQAILLVRPFEQFGRREVEWSHPCERNSFIYLRKGATRRNSVVNSRTVAGVIAHDLLSLLAVGEQVTDAEPLDVIGENSLQSLYIFALADPKGAARALREATDVFRNACKTSVAQILTGDAWEVESDILNNGVSVSPDLLADGAIIEIKCVSDRSVEEQLAKNTVQLESYLAWAMVEFGLESVVGSWKGKLLLLRWSDPEPIFHTVQPTVDLIADRIENRHKLILATEGRWLPRPSKSCNSCRYARPDEVGGSVLPSPCQFHCQTERNWDCTGGPEGDCPLLGQCDQFNKFYPYERLDLFNQLRDELYEKEREWTANETLTKLVSNDEGSGWILNNLRVGSTYELRGEVQLHLPRELRPYGDLLAGNYYEMEWQTEFSAAHVARLRILRRLSSDELVCRVERGAVSGLHENAEVRLRRTIRARFPARDQLAYLDRLQRSGQDPLSLRLTGEPSKVEAKHYHQFSAVPPDATFVVIDQLNREAVGRVADEVVRASVKEKRRVLVIGGETLETYKKAKGDLSSESIAIRFGQSKGTADSRLNEVTKVLTEEYAVFIPQEDFYQGRLDSWLNPLSNYQVDTVLVPEADRVPLIGIQRCFDLRPKRLVLVGQALASGADSYDSAVSQGILHQNAIRLLFDSARYVLPTEVKDLHLVRPAKARVALGLDSVKGLGLHHFELTSFPCKVHLVDGETGALREGFRVATRVLGSPGYGKKVGIEASIPEGTRIDAHKLKTLLRSLLASRIEQLDESVEGGLDASLFGQAVEITKLTRSNEPADAKIMHEVGVMMPPTSLPVLARNSLRNETEAKALVDFAKTAKEEVIVISPYTAQNLLIAKIATEEGVALQVYSTNEFGARRRSGGYVLLLSMVATIHGSDAYLPPPLDDTGELLPAFLTDCDSMHVFCSQSIADHHPLIRKISRI